MAVQAWDTAQSLRSMASQLDHFLYIDGKTSPKIAQPKEQDLQECLKLLEEVRQFMWDESKELKEAIQNGC